MDPLGLSDADRQRLSILAQAQHAASVITQRMVNPMGLPTLNPQLAGLNGLTAHPSFMTNTYKRRNATKENTAPLKEWLRNNEKNPYPSKNEKMMLAVIGGMSLTQVSTWFANARRRMKKEIPGQPAQGSDESGNTSQNLSTSSSGVKAEANESTQSSSNTQSPNNQIQAQKAQSQNQAQKQNPSATSPTGRPLNTSISTISNTSNTSGAPSANSDPPSPNQDAQNKSPNLAELIQKQLMAQALPQASPQVLALQRHLEEVQKRQIEQARAQAQAQQMAAAQLAAQAVQAQAQAQQVQAQQVAQAQAQAQQVAQAQAAQAQAQAAQAQALAAQHSPLGSHHSGKSSASLPCLTKRPAEEEEDVVVDDDGEQPSESQPTSKTLGQEHTVSIGSTNPVQMKIPQNSHKIWSIADML